MEESNKKHALAKAMMNVEYYPAILEGEEASLQSYSKLPLAEVSSIGVAFEPLAMAFQNILGIGGGGSGLYRVTVPGSGQLAKFKQESAYLGSVLTESGAVGGGQARLTPLACDPTMLFMAAALMGINQKLDGIQEAQQEIIAFLEQKEKSKLRGNLNFLTDVLNNYKYNWNNEKYKHSNHIKVLDIKQDSEQSLLFYREQIRKKAKKKSLFHGDKDVKEKLEKIQSDFREYQLALYLYAFSSFLEVMLLENFESSYLDAIAHKIEDYAFQYRELYSECYDQIEGDARSSMQAHLLSGLASINRVAGDAVAKIPVISKSQIDETLIETGHRLGEFGTKRTAEAMKQFASHQSSAVYPFVENIKLVNELYNNPMDVLFDNENIYIGSIDGQR